MGLSDDRDIQALLDEIDRLTRERDALRAAHQEIVRKYERIMGDPPDWTKFTGPGDQRLVYAREAWFGAAQISRKAIGSIDEQRTQEAKP